MISNGEFGRGEKGGGGAEEEAEAEEKEWGWAGWSGLESSRPSGGEAPH